MTSLVEPTLHIQQYWSRKVADLDGRGDADALPGSRQPARVTQHVLREGVDGLLVYVGAFLRDLVDDTVEGITRRIKPR